MNLWKSLQGQVVVLLTSADVPGALIALNESGIGIRRAEYVDELTVRLTLSRNHLARVRQLAGKRGEKLELLSRSGLYWTMAAAASRPVLLSGIAAVLVLSLLLPTRVLFVRVEGNETVPSRQIITAAEECGIRFGASRREIRSEKVKNALLGALPQLQWAGVNTSGCVAVISVRERGNAQTEVPSGDISSIVAGRDGIILSCTVTKGSGQCVPGQAVREGQVLISGYTDCGLLIRAARAEGEIMAQTRRQVTAVSLSRGRCREDSGAEYRCYSLILGKKRINLWNGSRICDATCGRMYEEYYITLPGGFVLPAALAVDTHICCETGSFEKPEERMQSDLSEFAREYTGTQMVGGSILQEDTGFHTGDGIGILKADYLCREMIGQRRQEEMGEANGKSD